jgi:hypothetical protein
MVVFDLTCINGHQFEGWFESLADLEKQIAEKMVVCPICEEVNVVRRPSTFGLVKSRPENNQFLAKDNLNPNMAQLVKVFEQLKELTQTLEADFVDVGANFTDEALKIHYGVNPKRNIRGLSTTDQEKLLKDEGVEFFKVPMLIRKTPMT